jgi:PKD repeat protein
MKNIQLLILLLLLGIGSSCHKKSVDEVVFNETLQPAPSSLVADFVIENQDGTVNEKAPVLLLNKCQNAVSYEWNFGNGITSTQAIPTLAYQMCGNYTITLKVKDIKGFEQQVSKDIVVLCIFGGIAHDF